jgi:hypothetical protein
VEVTEEQADFDDLSRLLKGGAADAEVCDAFDRLLVSLNAAGSASKYFAAAGYICAQRPHLAEQLLNRPIHGCLVIGATSAEDVIRSAVAVSHDPWYAILAGPDGVRWLREELPELFTLLRKLVEHHLEEFKRISSSPQEKTPS